MYTVVWRFAYWMVEGGCARLAWDCLVSDVQYQFCYVFDVNYRIFTIIAQFGNCDWTYAYHPYANNSAFHPSGVGKSSTILTGWG